MHETGQGRDPAPRNAYFSSVYPKCFRTLLCVILSFGIYATTDGTTGGAGGTTSGGTGATGEDGQYFYGDAIGCDTLGTCMGNGDGYYHD